MLVTIDSAQRFISDAPGEHRQSAVIAPHTANDGTNPDGMRKARWTGAWDNNLQQWSGGNWIDDEAVQLETRLTAQRDRGYIDSIDSAAGRARLRFVSSGWGIEEEYRRAETEARAFALAGYPAGAIPPAVQAEIRNGITAQQAADTIIAKADSLYAALDTIRTARLNGKAAVNAAVTDAEKAASSAAAVAELDAIQPAITGS